MLGSNDLVLCSGTLLKHGFSALVDAAVAGGYQAVTLWPQDVEAGHAEGLSTADMRSKLADNGLVVADLDPLLTWSELVVPRPGEAIFEPATENDFYEIAESFGARSVNAVQGFGATLDLDRAAEDLAAVCDRAREHGLLITIEFLPWSGIPNATTALDLVTRTGRDNATVLVDSWHWFRGDADLDALRRLPGDKIGSVQLNDAPTDPWDDVTAETLAARLLPGEGDIPLTDLVRVLDEIGSNAPIGVEVFNDRHDTMDPAEIGRQTADATRGMLAVARS